MNTTACEILKRNPPGGEMVAGVSANGAYGFQGRHFLASYAACDLAALTNVDALMAALEQAVRAAGATILSKAQHEFPGGGFTGLLLLGESHSSVHTYPEHAACFVDLFTCGDGCRPEAFSAVLRQYLRPQQVSEQCLARNRTAHFEAKEFGPAV